MSMLVVPLLVWVPIAFAAFIYVVVSRIQHDPDAVDAAAPLRRPLRATAAQLIVMVLALVLVAARIMLAGGVSVARTVMPALGVGAAIVCLGRSLRRAPTSD